MIQIDAPEKITNEAEFGEKLAEWLCSSPSLQHVLLCLHEGTHLLYTRAAVDADPYGHVADCRFEPKLYGPSDEVFFRHGIGWRRRAGGVESLPHEISLSIDIMLVAKNFLGQVYILEKLLGEDWKKQIWEESRGDLELYNKWYIMRHHIVGDMLDAEGSHILSRAKIRDSVHEDFAQPEFRRRLMSAAREYERRVFGT